MASSSGLSEDQFLCPICLDVFVKPVSTPCGHNFCMSCITSCWDEAPAWRCPICKEGFSPRPNLKVNTFISELVSHVRSLRETTGPGRSATPPPVVRCDVCTATRTAAVKSCLECLASYCDGHLEPHRVASGLRRHALVDPVENLASKVCREHRGLLRLFCRSDDSVLCDLCVGGEHGSHDVVPVQRAYEEKAALLGRTEAAVRRMIEERLQAVQNTRTLVRRSEAETKEVAAGSARDLAQLGVEMKKVQAELVRAVEEEQKSVEEQAEAFVRAVEGELCELKATAKNVERLKQTGDQLGFLRSFPTQSALPPRTADPSTVGLTRHLEAQRRLHRCFQSCVSQLRALLLQTSEEIGRRSGGAALGHVRRYEVSVVLDADTAHPLLSLSADGKQVRYNTGTGLWGSRVLSPNTFTVHLAVLGRRGFSSGRFYFEVHVGEKTEWCVGVATASIQRVGEIARNAGPGLWAVWFLLDRFETFSCPGVSVHAGKAERVGVFVDYDGGEVSFFDVTTSTPIHTFTECFFTEELYPYFNPCDNEYGSNLAPLVIVPAE